MSLYPDTEIEIQWRVIWFPPDKPDQIFVASEEKVRRRAQEQAEWNPIIERREVVVKPWEAAEAHGGD